MQKAHQGTSSKERSSEDWSSVPMVKVGWVVLGGLDGGLGQSKSSITEGGKS